ILVIGERKGRQWLRVREQCHHLVRQQYGPGTVLPIWSSEPHSAKHHGEHDACHHDAKFEGYFFHYCPTRISRPLPTTSWHGRSKRRHRTTAKVSAAECPRFRRGEALAFPTGRGRARLRDWRWGGGFRRKKTKSPPRGKTKPSPPPAIWRVPRRDGTWRP